MLVERDGKISTFQKEKYFNVHVGKGDLIADLEKVKTEEEAKKIAAACEKKQAVVSSLKRETKTVNPPKLYDLTTLQREANRYYGFTAQQTLDLVQTLYENCLLYTSNEGHVQPDQAAAHLFCRRCGSRRPDLLSGEGTSRLVYGGNADGVYRCV